MRDSRIGGPLVTRYFLHLAGACHFSSPEQKKPQPRPDEESAFFIPSEYPGWLPWFWLIRLFEFKIALALFFAIKMRPSASFAKAVEDGVCSIAFELVDRAHEASEFSIWKALGGEPLEIF